MGQTRLTEKRAEALLEKVRSAVEVSARADFDLCWLLYECDRSVVYVGDDPVYVYETWGYKTWFDFVEVEVGVHEQTANVYRKIGKVFGGDMAGAWDSGSPLPVTKMAILAAWSGLTRGNVQAKVNWARNKTCCHLRDELLGEQRAIHMAFGVTKQEQREINRAIDLARNRFDEGSDMTRGELLAAVVEQWSQIAKKERPKLRAVG